MKVGMPEKKKNLPLYRGGSRIFMGGGGGAQKIMCSRLHRERENKIVRIKHTIITYNGRRSWLKRGYDPYKRNHSRCILYAR